MAKGDSAEKPARAGKGRPTFAAGFPEDPALDALVAAFVAGDYARVRAEAPKLAASSEDPAVQKAARTLRDRIEPDRLALGLLALTGALLVALSAWWIINGHAPASTNAPTSAPSSSSSIVAPPTTIERIH